MKSLLLFALCVTATLAIPQQSMDRTTTAEPVTSEFLTCFRGCRAPSPYNPVCGTNNENYMNEQSLFCAKSCGRNVQLKRTGYCSSSRSAYPFAFV